MRYLVRTGENLGELMIRVEESCQLGFKPIGGIAVIYDLNRETPYYYQAVVSENDELSGGGEIDNLIHAVEGIGEGRQSDVVYKEEHEIMLVYPEEKT